MAQGSITKKITIRSILALFWRHTRRYKGRMFLVLSFVALATGAEAAQPWLLKHLFDLLERETPSTANMDLFLPTILALVSVMIFGWICWRFQAYHNNRFQPRVMADLEESAFTYLLGHSLGFFADSFAGALVKRVHRLSSSFERLADEITFRLVAVLVVLIGAVIGLSLQKPILALGFILWTTLFLVLQYYATRWAYKADIQRSTFDSEAGAALADAISNATTIKLFPAAAYETGRFRTALDRLSKARTRSWDRHEAIFAMQGTLMIGINIAFLYIAVKFWIAGVFTLGDIAFIQAYLVVAFNRLWEVGRAFRHVFDAFADAEEMVGIMQTPHEIRDVRKAKELGVRKGNLNFKNVRFNYRGARTVLDNFSLSIAPHEKVALVGPSGAGKSTVTKLLMRFHNIQRGKITIDGQDISRVTQESLRQNVALVPQEPILFHRTLMENIRYGRRDARDEEVIAAAKLAHCHEFISGLKEGYATFVGERGVKLSGGERQRVAIARAILKNAPILILDEATSSLDSESEALIQDALTKLMKDKTTIVIAHRLSTILKMDRIVVMDKGKVVDTGTHTALIKKHGIYKTLWEIQAGGFIGE